MSSEVSLRKRPLHVTIVSDNPETLDGLETYLRRAGVTTRGTRQIERSAELTTSGASAVVLFPDDFAPESVLAALAALGLRRPSPVLLLVTREPRRFASLPSSSGSIAPLVVPKPAWGWTILDTIRARLDSEEGSHE